MVEYDRKVDEIHDELIERLEGHEIGDSLDFNGYDIIVCDEDGETTTKELKNLIIGADFEVVGGEDKVIRFKTEDEEERFEIDIPLTIFKEIAKGILF